MTRDVAGGILNGVIHDVMGGGVIVEICPGAKLRVRPGCIGSGVQFLIRSRVPGRKGQLHVSSCQIRQCGFICKRQHWGENHYMAKSIGLNRVDSETRKYPSVMPQKPSE